MNEPSPSSSTPRFWQPLPLLAGVTLGLLAMAWAGRAVTGHDWHRNFVRFHPLIAPESNYQPTIAEMRAIVRARCRPDQILVIVGGNSIFQGVGQPVEKLWSKRLQELLGDRYAVVNLAFRGSSPTDGGALVAESLRDEFPRQVYLANVPPFTAASPAGGLDYRFMLFDAHYKGWLLEHAPRQAAIEDYLDHTDVYPQARELSLGGRLDAWLRFRDFWNWWSATRFFTFPGPLTPEWSRAFRARAGYPDREPDFENIPVEQRFSARGLPVEMEITRSMSALFYETDSSGQWQPAPIPYNHFVKFSRDAFPEPLRARTLIVLSPNAPFYTQRLSPAESARDVLAFRDSLAIWRDHGYAATAYGEGFTDHDFGDRTHLSATGGHKLASLLAPEIRSLADRLGYPNP
jgi:hypothetical protein